MKLVPVSAVREKLGFDAIPTIDAAIDAALEGATASLEAGLITEFVKTSQVDTFYVDRDAVKVRANPRLLMKLSRGFVRASPAIEVDSGARFSDLNTSSATDLATEAQLMAEMGTVMLLLDDPLFLSFPRRGREIEEAYLQARYDAGFDEDPSDSELYLQSEVPSWLKQVAMSSAIIELDKSPVVRSEKQSVSAVEIHRGILARTLDVHARYEPTALLPIIS